MGHTLSLYAILNREENESKGKRFLLEHKKKKTIDTLETIQTNLKVKNVNLCFKNKLDDYLSDDD